MQPALPMRQASPSWPSLAPSPLTAKRHTHAPPAVAYVCRSSQTQSEQWPLNEVQEVWPPFSPMATTLAGLASKFTPVIHGLLGALGLKLAQGGQLLIPIHQTPS